MDPTTVANDGSMTDALIDGASQSLPLPLSFLYTEATSLSALVNSEATGSAANSTPATIITNNISDPVAGVQNGIDLTEQAVTNLGTQIHDAGTDAKTSVSNFFSGILPSETSVVASVIALIVILVLILFILGKFEAL